MIRKIILSDKNDFLRMCNEFYSMDCVSHPIPQINIEQTFSILTSNSPFTDAYMYIKDGKPVGYILIALTYSNEAGGMVVWLEEIYVCNEYRSQGIGSELIDFILKKYMNETARFRLEITDSNISAKRLYESKGFRDLPYRQMEI